MRSEYRLRRAAPSDLETIVAFTSEEAREAEGWTLDADDVRRGVLAGLEDPSLAVYWVAESADGRVVASTSAVREWSNFNGRYYWWVQSMFIAREHRGQGLVEVLLDRLAEEAKAARALDLRLYAHQSNRRALEAYRRCGFDDAPYVIMRRSLSMSDSEPENWSQQVTESSDALDLERGVFTWDDPKKIALSLKRSADTSQRRKGTPFQSAMSMLSFYINRAGSQLPADQRQILEQAKNELRELYGRPRLRER